MRAQLTVGTGHFCPKIVYEKLTKSPNFTWYLPERLSKCPNFLLSLSQKFKFPTFPMIFARSMPEFYTIIARNNIFPIFFFGGGRTCPPFHPSPTPMLKQILAADARDVTHSVHVNGMACCSHLLVTSRAYSLADMWFVIMTSNIFTSAFEALGAVDSICSDA